MKRLPDDIYRQCVAIAKSYYAMLRRRKEQEEEVLHGSAPPDGQPHGSGVGDPTARKAERLIAARQRNEQKIRAVEQAWARMDDDTAREFIRQNVFEGVPMQYIDLPMSISTMKRMRSKFVCMVAEELGET
ncbi:MAG TPA: hypothetical protein H9985_03950 [Candidatus Anaerofilum faecale]|nr:hypothetical protein [Candidatus Anaerofilum faecale]